MKQIKVMKQKTTKEYEEMHYYKNQGNYENNAFFAAYLKHIIDNGSQKPFLT